MDTVFLRARERQDCAPLMAVGAGGVLLGDRPEALMSLDVVALVAVVAGVDVDFMGKHTFFGNS